MKTQGGRGPVFLRRSNLMKFRRLNKSPIHPLHFLHLPGTPTQRAPINSFGINWLRTLSVTTEGVPPSPSTLSPAFCVSPYLAASLAKDSCSAVGTMQHSSGCRGFFAGVAHPEDAGRVPGSCGSRDVADFFAVEGEGRFRFGDGVAGKRETDALTVDLAAGADALDDLLAGVAALGVADVGVLQAGFVGDLLFAEVVAEPGDALSKAGGAQRGVAHRPAFVPARCVGKNLPKLRQFFALGEELSPGDSSGRALHDAAGHRTDSSAVKGKFFKLRDVNAGNLFDKRGGLRTLQRQRAVAGCLIGEGHVIHDDVFVEPFDQTLANHGEGDAEEPVGERVGFDLRENVPLRIQEQRNDAVPDGEVFDVVRQDGVQVADAVGSGEGKIGAVILVDQRDSLARIAKLGGGVSKVIRQGAAEPNAHLRARGKVHGRKRSVQSRAIVCAAHLTVGCPIRSHIHAFAQPPAFILAKGILAKRSRSNGSVSNPSLSTSGAGHAVTAANRFISNDILLPMSEGRTALNVATDGLIHITIPVGMLQCNCSIIGDPATREALVVDPGDEVTRILDLIGRYRLIVKAIVSTHAHIDHVGGLSKLHKYTGAPVLMHRDDLPLYQAMDMQAAFLGVLPPELTDVDQLLKEGDVLRWGRFEAQVIHTPGHTPGSVSLYLPHDAGKITAVPAIHTVLNEAGERIALADLLKKIGNPGAAVPGMPQEEAEKIAPPAPQLFSGDTLFAGSIGR